MRVLTIDIELSSNRKLEIISQKYNAVVLFHQKNTKRKHMAADIYINFSYSINSILIESLFPVRRQLSVFK